MTTLIRNHCSRSDAHPHSAPTQRKSATLRDRRYAGGSKSPRDYRSTSKRPPRRYPARRVPWTRLRNIWNPRERRRPILIVVDYEMFYISFSDISFVKTYRKIDLIWKNDGKKIGATKFDLGKIQSYYRSSGTMELSSSLLSGLNGSFANPRSEKKNGRCATVRASSFAFHPL